MANHINNVQLSYCVDWRVIHMHRKQDKISYKLYWIEIISLLPIISVNTQ